RYTRTKALFNEFVGAFAEADFLILNDIYPASEAPIPGVSSAALAAAIKEKGQRCVEHISGQEEIVEFLLKTVGPGDTVLTLGAGNIYKLGESLLNRLAAGKDKK
ncbi:MAG TPA: UDP-N-acetylmuramate--L-alanine ligase, partial [Smithellaceae bacterium]|nr:UDP-N-acetylmuramate--L-alanine ligase [Smithellaceae bacterium]